MRLGLGLAWLGLLCAVVTIGAAALGHLHPALDSLGVWLLYGIGAAMLCLLIALIGRRWPLAALSTATLATGLAQALPHAGPFTSQPAGDLRLLQHNLNFRNPATDLADRIDDFDLVTLQEVRAAAPRLDSLGPGGAHHLCPGAGRSTAVISRLPVIDRGCVAGGAWMQVQAAQGPVTILSLHLLWPWPYGQANQMDRLLPDLRALPRPVIVAGDFNQTPWSASMAKVAAATETQRLGGLASTFTFVGGLARINIDHVLVPERWAGSFTLTPDAISGHLALAAQIGPVQ